MTTSPGKRTGRYRDNPGAPNRRLRQSARITWQDAMTPDFKQGIYPFKDLALSRADVEWLLATHENGRGAVDWSDESQRARTGLDLRGADLRRVDLQNLPLACTLGHVSWQEREDLTQGERTMAALLLEQADLKGAHLEQAQLSY